MDCSKCGYDIQLQEVEINAWSEDGADIIVEVICPECGLRHTHIFEQYKFEPEINYG